MIKRKKYTFQEGDVIDIEEFHDGRYGAPGTKREKKKKVSKEEVQRVNHYNKVKKCRRYLLEYFSQGDLFITWTYEVGKRPEDMQEAKQDFSKAMRYIRKEYKKRGQECFWIRNIEQGTKGAWHIHLVIKSIPGATDILTQAWRKGGAYVERIILSERLTDKDFMKLAQYMTKDEHTAEKKKDGSRAKPRIRISSYSHSRNMQLKPPKEDKLIRFRKEAKPKEGYYIERIYEGINPKTGYRFRHYTMIRINRRI